MRAKTRQRGTEAAASPRSPGRAARRARPQADGADLGLQSARLGAWRDSPGTSGLQPGTRRRVAACHTQGCSLPHAGLQPVCALIRPRKSGSASSTQPRSRRASPCAHLAGEREGERERGKEGERERERAWAGVGPASGWPGRVGRSLGASLGPRGERALALDFGPGGSVRTVRRHRRGSAAGAQRAAARRVSCPPPPPRRVACPLPRRSPRACGRARPSPPCAPPPRWHQDDR